MTKIYILLFTIALFVLPAVAQQSESDREMNQPVEPFRIVGNIYYVGASDVTSYLITTPKGHILIDAGFEETVPQIKANVEKLGFKLTDVKILLLNHAHYDHCGGMSEMKKLTGAKLYASPPDAKYLADGGASDFLFGGKATFKPVKVDGLLKDGQIIKLGGTSLTTLFTFGHTKGATSWTTTVREDKKTLSVLFMSSMSMLDYKLTNNKDYPEIAEDFARTYAIFKSIKPDIHLVAHGQFFELTEKAAKLRRGVTPNPFIDPNGYRDLVETMTKRFQDRLVAEKAGVK